MTRLAPLRSGFETMARLLAGTLGPTQGAVLSAVGRNGSERLVDSASIVRRIVELEGRGESAGAAIARDMVRKVGERHGDGGATAAVLAHGVLRHAVRVVAAGANPVLVRTGITTGVEVAVDALKTQAEPVTAESDMAGLAAAATGDPALGALVGELAGVLGPEGAVQIEECPSSRVDAELSHDYVDGARWRGRPASRTLLPEGKTELTLVEPTVVVADAEVRRVEQILALLEVAPALPGRPPLLLIAREIDGHALSVLSHNDATGKLVSAPVVLTGPKTRLTEELADIALLTGAKVLSPERGLPLESVRREHLGQARRVLVERGHLTLIGGYADPAAIAERAARMRNRAWEVEDATVRDRLWLRQARLLGRVGVLRVGGATDHLLEERRAKAGKAIRLVHAALRDGVVAGGGVCFLDCVAAVRAARGRLGNSDEALGLDAVCAGLERPFLQLVANSGETAPRVRLENARTCGPGHGVDVTTGAFVHMKESGIRDVAGVAMGALEAAGETAGLLISAAVPAGREVNGRKVSRRGVNGRG